VNPVLAAGQLIVAVALSFSILLQSRGSGLGGTFGGDSAIYRSRRGIERRLWQFTIILIALFTMFSLAAYLLSPAA
jgi:preprotein translocase subunit SecG